MPYGSAGWAFMLEAIRRRGAPKYARAEPVLCVGYQHMYTTVYKCLTRHSTIVHSEQVDWSGTAPRGVFLSADNSPPEEAILRKLGVDLFPPKQPDLPRKEAEPTGAKRAPARSL